VTVDPYGLFEFRGSIAGPAQGLRVKGTMINRFSLNVKSTALVSCSLMADDESLYYGECKSSAYILKSKKEAGLESKTGLNVSIHWNRTGASVTITIGGRVDRRFLQEGDLSLTPSSDPNAEPLDTSVVSGNTLEQSFRHGLRVGESANYSFKASSEIWINITANVTVRFTIDEETTVVIVGDCRRTELFAWVKRDCQLNTRRL